MEGLSDLINAETEEQRMQSLQQHMGIFHLNFKILNHLFRGG